MSSAASIVDRGAAARSRSGAVSQRRGRDRVSQQERGVAELPDDVVARVRGGDERALEMLFRAYFAQLCAFAARYVREDALAEELVQDVFADVWARRSAWELRGPVRAYLFAAVRNRALNARKRQATERDWERDESVTEIRSLHREPAGADELLERAELRARVTAAVESLPERCRLVMHLRWREGMPHAEIAQVMGISVKGVEMQLSRGLKALRVLFAR